MSTTDSTTGMLVEQRAIILKRLFPKGGMIIGSESLKKLLED
jgi:hypothetical protein